MREICLSRGEVALVDDEDFELVNQWKWHATKNSRYTYASHSQYVPGQKSPKTTTMHRLIMGCPDLLVVHIDKNGLNNQKSNLRYSMPSQMKTAKDHIGLRYGRLTVQSQWRGERYVLYGFCKCDCGVEKRVRISHMVAGKISSCGCLNAQRIKTLNLSHGECHKTKEYRAWRSMRQRCYDNNLPGYKDYGGRGIKVCDRWIESYENFISDIGRAPSPKHSIDRINNDGNYEPGNCRWATRKEQANNKRPRSKNVKPSKCRKITLNGITKTINEWGFELDIPTNSIRNRLSWGWPIENVLDKCRYNRWNAPNL